MGLWRYRCWCGGVIGGCEGCGRGEMGLWGKREGWGLAD